MLIGKVEDIWYLEQRGLIVILKTPIAQLPKGLRLKIGDGICFRTDGRTVKSTTVEGIEHCDPYTPKQLFSILLPKDISKAEIPIGAEVLTEP